MNDKSKVLFSSFKKEDPDFDEAVLNANKVWRKAFNCEYDAGECLRYSNNFEDSVMIGRIDNKPVCAAIIEYWNDIALISCMGVYPQKCGHGSSLMQHIVEHLKDSGVIKTYLKIDKDEKADRLEKFYSNFGFAKYEVDKEDVLFDYDPYLDLDLEYVMSYSGSANSV